MTANGSHLLLALCAATLTLVSACSSPDTVGPSSVAVSRSAAAISSSRVPRTLDDEFASIADGVPGFGGLFIANGQLYAYLTDTSRAAALRSVLGRARFLGRHRGKVIRVLRGDYDVRDLKRWNELATAQLSNIRGTIYFDLNEAENRLNIVVESDAVKESVEAAASQLGIPVGALVVKVGATPRINTDYLSSVGLRPFGGGMAVGMIENIGSWSPWAAGCTYGITVWNGSGSRYAISNSHCTPYFWEQDGDSLYQSSLNSSQYVGAESLDPAPFTSMPCPSGKKCRWSETALWTLASTSDTTTKRGWIMRTTYADSVLGSTQIDTVPNNAFVIQMDSVGGEGEVLFPLMYDNADIMGSVRGWTTGLVITTSASVNLSGSGITSTIHFSGDPFLLCQYQTSAYSTSGNSGAPVFQRLGTYDGDGRERVSWLGIVWGSTAYPGTAWFSGMAYVGEDLGLNRTGKAWGFVP